MSNNVYDITFQESACLYVILIMAIYWITESLPLSVTALIPLFLFPLFGVLTAKRTATEYVQVTLLLFLHSFHDFWTAFYRMQLFCLWVVFW